MASKHPLRLLLATRSPLSHHFHPLRKSSNPVPISSIRASFSTSPLRSQENYETEAEQRPRWQMTPKRMVAPYRSRPRPANNNFVVNNDPKRLDDVYVRMLGKDGDKILSDEVKWLAVTHKSFDHGRRGFNDRLALLGRRIVSLQTSLALINSPQPTLPTSGNPSELPTDSYGRTPFTHPALTGLSNLTSEAKDDILSISRLANLAERYGLDKVVRWKPKKADNLQGSGIESVLTSSIYAIIGAVALEKGGEVANRTVRDRILNPLGLI